MQYCNALLWKVTLKSNFWNQCWNVAHWWKWWFLCAPYINICFVAWFKFGPMFFSLSSWVVFYCMFCLSVCFGLMLCMWCCRAWGVTAWRRVMNARAGSGKRSTWPSRPCSSSSVGRWVWSESSRQKRSVKRTMPQVPESFHLDCCLHWCSRTFKNHYIRLHAEQVKPTLPIAIFY